MTQFANLGQRTAGDDYVVELTILDSDGEVLNINGLEDAKFELSTSARPPVPVFSKALGTGIEVTSGVDGEMSITWDAEDTEGLSGTHVYEVEIRDFYGNTFTPIYGYVTFRAALIANAS